MSSGRSPERLRGDGSRERMAPSTRVGMQQVAERAGVALSSVSRALSGHPDVSAVMRNRVLDAVAVLGYEPDILAQSLRRGATMTVGFLVGNISNPLFAEIALGAETRLRAADYTMLLANAEDSLVERAHLRLFRQRRVDGLLLSLIDESSDDAAHTLEKTAVPTVLVDRDPVKFRGSSAVLSDHATGMQMAMATLVEMGHRRIGLVNGDVRVRPGRERAAAMRRFAKRAPGVTTLIRNGSFSAAHGEGATEFMLRTPKPPTAIIAGGNQVLVGVLRSIRKNRARVPRDLSLVTCDAVALSEFLEPPLATISRDPRLMGEVAAELLLEGIAGLPPRTVTLPTGFTVAGSCASPSEPQNKAVAAETVA
jgi:LacI family transcriptional regulator